MHRVANDYEPEASTDIPENGHVWVLGGFCFDTERIRVPGRQIRALCEASSEEHYRKLPKSENSYMHRSKEVSKGARRRIDG